MPISRCLESCQRREVRTGIARVQRGSMPKPPAGRVGARAGSARKGGSRQLRGDAERGRGGPETSGRFQIFSCYLGRTLRQSRQIGPVPAVRIIGKNPQSSSSTSDLAMKWT